MKIKDLWDELLQYDEDKKQIDLEIKRVEDLLRWEDWYLKTYKIKWK